VVPYPRADEGVNVTTVFALLSEDAPGTEAPVGSLSVNVTEELVTAWLKVAVGEALTATPLAPDAGVVAVTAGGWLAEGVKIGSTQ
jgi:hypothetical protein